MVIIKDLQKLLKIQDGILIQIDDVEVKERGGSSPSNIIMQVKHSQRYKIHKKSLWTSNLEYKMRAEFISNIIILKYVFNVLLTTLGRIIRSKKMFCHQQNH